jgi:hypothetical protein
MEPKVVVKGTGHIVEVRNHVDRIPEFDPRSGEHYWIVLTTYKVDPEKFTKGEGFLDTENLVSVSPPGCYHCEQVYTPYLAHRRCKGEGN